MVTVAGSPIAGYEIGGVIFALVLTCTNICWLLEQVDSAVQPVPEPYAQHTLVAVAEAEGTAPAFCSAMLVIPLTSLDAIRLEDPYSAPARAASVISICMYSRYPRSQAPSSSRIRNPALIAISTVLWPRLQRRSHPDRWPATRRI
jgi:hypothetical protein